MRVDEYGNLDGLSLATLVRQNEVTGAELAELAAKACARINPALNAVRELWTDGIGATDVEAPFSGVPFLLKDLSATAQGQLHECGSLLLEGQVVASDSAFSAKCRDAGFNLMGRTASPEFGWSASTESRLAGITCNPWNPELSAGGSSGGAAAAVAAGIVPIAHASDGSGSIRNPASWCGLVGLKPSRGRVSNSPGLGMPPGGRPAQFVVSRTLRDTAAALDALAGSVPGDPFEIARPKQGFLAALNSSRRPLRIAFTTQAPSGGTVSADVVTATKKTVLALAEMGHQIEEARPIYDWDGLVDAILDTASAGIARRIDLICAAKGIVPSADLIQHTTLAAYRHGKTLSAGDLIAAMEHLDKLSRDVAKHFETYDVFLTPTSTCTAPRHRTHDADNAALTAREWSDRIHAEDAFLLLANVTGHPAFTLPLHQGVDNLPIGIHLEARCGSEATLLSLAAELGEAFPWEQRRPPIHVAGTPDA
jgi:amidase